VVGSARKRAEPLRQFAFNEQCGPIGDPVTNIEVDVMNFNVSKVMGDNFAHRTWARCHLSHSVPHPVRKRIPRCLKKPERVFEVGAKFGG